MIMYHQTKFGCQGSNCSENIVQSHTLTITALAVTLTLKIATTEKQQQQNFSRSLWLMMLHHHTKFNKKNVLWFRKYHPGKHSLKLQTFTVTLTLNPVIPFFHRTLRLMMLYYQTKYGCKWSRSLEDTTEIVIFWLYKPSLWPWHWTQWTNFLHDSLAYDAA